jgi:membrane dipeptidase
MQSNTPNISKMKVGRLSVFNRYHGTVVSSQTRSERFSRVSFGKHFLLYDIFRIELCREDHLLVESPQCEITVRAKEIHFRSILVDTHVDTTQRLLSRDFDLGVRHIGGSVDIPAVRDGGVDAIFFAIWTPGTVIGPEAVHRASEQIEAIRRHLARHAGEMVLARTADDIRRAKAANQIALLLGLEGGQMINGNLDVLREYASLGVRYVTLTHNFNTDWADSSTDQPFHNGLNDFGKDAIREMNRLGVMVDVSHVSDKTFADVVAISAVPVIASHSSCRAICDAPRNMSDEMIRTLADTGGVIQINFHIGFLSQEFRNAMKEHLELQSHIEALAKERVGENQADQWIEGGRIVREMVNAGTLPRVEWTQIIDHIDHAVEVAGIDHVGLGSDFDGADMPYGMEDASCLPRITNALLQGGYSEADVEKILGGNTLRLMQDVEAVSS